MLFSLSCSQESAIGIPVSVPTIPSEKDDAISTVLPPACRWQRSAMMERMLTKKAHMIREVSSLSALPVMVNPAKSVPRKRKKSNLSSMT